MKVPWHFWLCIVIVSGSGLALDVPFVFGEETDLTSHSSAWLEEASSSSTELVGVPSVISPSDNDTVEIPITAGGSTSEDISEKKLVADLKDKLNKRVEPDNLKVREEAELIASTYAGDHRIDQICEIFNYLKYGEYPAKRGW
jgi:hypothetical protein